MKLVDHRWAFEIRFVRTRIKNKQHNKTKPSSKKNIHILHSSHHNDQLCLFFALTYTIVQSNVKDKNCRRIQSLFLAEVVNDLEIFSVFVQAYKFISIQSVTFSRS